MKKIIIALLTLFIGMQAYAQNVSILGSMEQNELIEILADDDGVWHQSSAGLQSPFLSRYFSVEFKFISPGSFYGSTWDVPGFFSGDGNAAYSGNNYGHTFKAYFIPVYIGQYEVKINFRQGIDIGRSMYPNTFPIDTTLHGYTDTINVLHPTYPTSFGYLMYNGSSYPEYTSKYSFNSIMFTAAGPENFLAFRNDNDNSAWDLINDQYIKIWSQHWVDSVGGPSWSGPPTKNGSGMFGAINYLSQYVNNLSMTLFTAHGMDGNVFPYHALPSCIEGQDDFKKRHFSIPKMEKWAVVWKYMNDKGMNLEAVLHEGSNDRCFSTGDRILYYRTMVALLSCKKGLTINLGEQNDWVNEYPGNSGIDSLTKWVNFIKDIYPYDGLRISVNSSHESRDSTFLPLLGTGTLTSMSLTDSNYYVHDEVKRWVRLSKESNDPWIVTVFQAGDEATGTPLDPNFAPWNPNLLNISQDKVRREVIWGSLFAQAGGVGIYFGDSYAHSDISLTNYRSRHNIWEYMGYARNFINQFPYHLCYNADSLMKDDSLNYLLALDPYHMAFYQSNGGDMRVKLPNSLSSLWQIVWFNPITGNYTSNQVFTSNSYFKDSEGYTIIPAPISVNHQDYAGLLFSNSTIPLSVSYTHFDGINTEYGAKLEWVVSEEIDIDKYYIYFQDAATSRFEIIDSVYAKGGGTYQYKHNKNLSGMVFYRIEGISYEGVSYSSNTLQLFGEASADYISRFIPLIDQKVYMPTGNYILLNHLGQRVITDNLSSGVYYLTVPSKGFSKKVSIR